MSKKPRLSAEDKRNVVLSIFHETADVYVLKDVEKLGSKRGINSMLIKEILQSLVDDNLVHQEKIGISNYFWSFPSEASAKLQSEGEKLSADVQRVEQRAAAQKEKLGQEKESKQQTDKHREGMEQITALRDQVAKLEVELRQFQSTDPDLLRTMRQGTQVAHDAANRWLDNIYCLMTWCRKKYPGQEAELAAFFKEEGYSDDLDYL